MSIKSLLGLGVTTIMFIPDHDSSRVRVLTVPRLFFLLFGFFVIVSFVTSVFFITYRLSETFAESQSYSQASIDNVEEELQIATNQMNESLRKAESVMNELITAAKDQEKELNRIRDRYDNLKSLVAGKEDIARVYREILKSKSMKERVSDIAIGFITGFTATLLATLLLYRFKSRIGSISDLDQSGQYVKQS